MTSTITTTLSDEIPYSEILARQICDEAQCQEFGEDVDCQLCSTPKCGTGTENTNRTGLTYQTIGGPENELGYWPAGCITPGSSSLAFSTECAGNGDHTAQTSQISFWFKDLVVDAAYVFTVTFKRCEFAKDENGDHLVPSCQTGVPCVEGVENTTLTTTIEFTAENWAEIFSDRCDDCSLLYLKCDLEDEAYTWNEAHKNDEGYVPRTVFCDTPGLEVPSVKNHYTWFDSCTLELAAP